jgi:hypothetical protein
MAITITKEQFESYFEQINNQPMKVGELDKVEAKLISASEHKSDKSGKTSIKLEIDYNGFIIKTYLGISTEKSIEISRAKLLRVAVACIGVEASRKLFNDSAADEDVENDVDLLIEFASKLSKKLKKNPVNVIVSRKKDEAKGMWDVTWYIKDEDLGKESEEKSESDIFDALK